MSNAPANPPVARSVTGAADEPAIPDPAIPDPAALDAHGFDPDDFEWRPVPRRPRADGWTPDVQRAFIEALGRTGIVEQAAREVDRSVKSAYTLRNAPGGEAFARAWAAACRNAADRLLDIAFTRAIEGEEVPIFDQDGVRTGMKWRCNTRLTMFLLRAYHPDRFAAPDREGRRRDPAPARAAEPPVAQVAVAQAPVAQAIAALAPVLPAEPHRLMPPALLHAYVRDARWEAAKLAASPRDETEHYVWPRSPEDHPRVLDRAARRRARRAERDR